MKALVLEEYHKLVYRDVADPQPADNEVLIRVKACGICGSDVHGIDGSTLRRQPPVVMGHEAAGIIEACGAAVKNWQVGDRVTFDSTVYPLDDWYTLKGHYNLSDGREVVGVSPGTYRRHGAFAEYVAVPQHILYRLPGGVSFEQAAMVEPAAVAAHAVKLALVTAGSSAVVVGSGMIGAFIVGMLKASGAGPVIAVDANEEKLKTAARYGADVVIHSLKDAVAATVRMHTKGRGADVAFEAAGVAETVNFTIDAVRKGGTAVLVGNVSPTIDFPLQKVVTSEIRVQGSCAICGEYEMVLDLIASGKLCVDGMISAVAPLHEGAAWFDRLYNRTGDYNKIILIP